MLLVTVLGSGSKGNAILVEGRDTSVLIDAGFGIRTLARRLAQVNRKPEQIQALILTHEHTDHTCGALDACARWGWPLYATGGTLSALPDAIVPTVRIAAGKTVSVGSFAIDPTLVPHDASEPVALVFTDRGTGARAGVALDLGHVPETLVQAFTELDLLVIESNHDEQMLVNGPYPWSLKQRVGGQLGHLSNGAAAAFAAGCVHRGLRGIVLAHLSTTNNTPDVALLRARDALKRVGWRRDALVAAHQTTVCGPMSGTPVLTNTRTMQLGLEL